MNWEKKHKKLSLNKTVSTIYFLMFTHTLAASAAVNAQINIETNRAQTIINSGGFGRIFTDGGSETIALYNSW